MKVPRRLQATPIRLIKAMPPAGCVRSEHHKKTTWFKESSAFLQHPEGVVEMFNKMTGRDRIKRLIREPLIFQGSKVDRDAFFPRLSHGRGIEIEALDLPPELFHQLKLCTAAAA